MSRERNGIMKAIGRLVVVSVVLLVTSYLTPGFSIRGMWSFLLAAVVISVLDYAIEALIGSNVSPFGMGVKGFVISAIIIYLAQFFVPNMGVSILGALLAALVIGLLDGIFAVKVI